MHSESAPWRRLAIPTILVGIWTLVAVALALEFREIRLTDIHSFAERAASLDWELRTLVDGFHPWGYPAQLRVVAELVGDYQRAGQVLSLLGAMLALGSVWVIAEIGFGRAVAAIATMIVATDVEFTRSALVGGTDVPALAWMLAAIAALAAFGRSPQVRWAVVAGILLGVGYLVRYTVLVVLPAAILFMLLPAARRRHETAVHVVAFLFAFLVAASPQLVPTALAHGNPFWNRQDINVYFGIFGDGDWARNWDDATNRANGLAGIVANHPRAFLDNFLDNVSQLWHFWLPVELVLGAGVGLGMLASRRTDWRLGGLVVLVAASCAVGVSLAFVAPRLVLPVIPPLAILAAYGLMRIATLAVAVSAHRTAWRAAVVVATLGVVTLFGAHRTVALRSWAEPSDITDVSQALRSDGLESASEVFSFEHTYYDMGATPGELFEVPAWSTPGSPLDSVASVIASLRRQDRNYLVFNDAAVDNVRSLSRAWPPVDVPEEFVELHRGADAPHARVWRLRRPLPSSEEAAGWIGRRRDLDAFCANLMANSGSQPELAVMAAYVRRLMTAYAATEGLNGVGGEWRVPLASEHERILDARKVRVFVDAVEAFAKITLPGDPLLERRLPAIRAAIGAGLGPEAIADLNCVDVWDVYVFLTTASDAEFMSAMNPSDH